MINWEEKIKEKIREDNGSKEGVNPNEMRASSAGYCRRQMYLGKYGLKEFDDYILGSMQSGTITHDWIEKTFSTEILAAFENPVKFKEHGITFTGTYDCYDGETVYDFKTQNGVSYVEDSPKDKHVDQLPVYMKAIGAQKGAIVYIDKKSLETIQHQVRFSDERWNDIKERVRQVLEEVEADKTHESIQDIPFDRCGCYFCKNEDINLNKGEEN